MYMCCVDGTPHKCSDPLGSIKRLGMSSSVERLSAYEGLSCVKLVDYISFYLYFRKSEDTRQFIECRSLTFVSVSM
jgi:hypothetical protein